MIVVLLYPPAQMIGESDEIEAVGGELVHVIPATDAAPDVVKFSTLAELRYYVDPRRGQLMMEVRGLGPWSVRWGTWAAWRLPRADEMRGWTANKAAAAGLVMPDAKAEPKC